MNQFEYNGIWWLPENPDNMISGTLKFHPIEGINLELIGSFKEIKDFNAMLQHEIILGVSSDGENITLYKCYESQFNLARFSTSSFFVNIIFEGHHFKKEEDIILDSLSINYSRLEEWTKISGFQNNTEYDASKNIKKMEIAYAIPQKVEANLDNLKISLDYNFSLNRKGIEDYHLKQTTFIKIEPDKPIHYNDFQNNICYHIQNFLSLAIGKATDSLIIKGKTVPSKNRLPAGSVEHEKILIFHSVKGLSDLSKPIHPLDMLFLFEDISDDFENCLKNWITKSELLQPVYDLYFGTLYNSSMYIQHEFLSLIQALESYHRRIHDGKYVPEDHYSQIYDVLIDAIPDVDKDFKESLKQKMKYHNEFSLRKRIKEIFIQCNNLTNLIIPNKTEFIEDVVNTRNFLTHYDKKIESKAKTGQELYHLVQKIKFLLEICFLIELEISKENIETLVSRNRRYQSIANI